MPDLSETKNKIKKFFVSKAKNKKIVIIALISIIFIIFSFCFINNDESFYSKTIAKVTKTENSESKVTDTYKNTDTIIEQKVSAVIINGVNKGDEIEFKNKASYSQANDMQLKKNDKIFIQYDINAGKITNVQILDFKRDNYLIGAFIVFIFLILIVGGYKGLRSLISLAVNTAIIILVVEAYIRGANLIVTASISGILFIVLSIFLMGGKNKKSISAIAGTIICTAVSMLIAFIVIKAAGGNGIHYEEMEFLTKPPAEVFTAEILIGTIGAIMDIAISMSAAVWEIYNTTPDISNKELIKSGRQIGSDIMGTMANTLIFAYIGGSIPIILIWLKNCVPISEIVGVSLSLEVIRALTGSIGIVISIPITLYISVMFLKNNKVKEG